MNLRVKNHPIFGVIHCQGLGALLRGSDLRGADLSGADLSGADLRRSDLSGSDLRRSDLSRADLGQVILRRADLSEADLSGSFLLGASLRVATLRGTSLRGVDLSKVDLYEVGLYEADLTGTCLDPRAKIPTIDDREAIEAGLSVVGNLVFGWRTKRSRYVGSAEYSPGRCYRAPVFSVASTECHPGLYLCGKNTVESKEYRGYGKVRVFCRRDELHHAGDKWRAKRLWVCRSDEWADSVIEELAK